MAKKKTKTKITVVPFEQSLEQLKEVVSQLENGNLTLTESLETYEQGVKNLKNCYQSLEAVQKKIKLLVDVDENGNLSTLDFDDSATHQPVERGDAAPEISKGTDSGEIEDIDDPNSLF